MIRITNKIMKIIMSFIKISMSILCVIFGLDKATGFKIKKTKYKLERLGTKYGGWIIPIELLNENSICYSAGAGEDISFDCLLAEKFRCDVFIFDPTPRAIAHFEKLKKSVLSGQTMSINRSQDLFYEIQKENVNKLKYYGYGIWKIDGIQKFYAPKIKEWVSHAIINNQNNTEYFEAECKTIQTIMNDLGHKKLDLLKIDIEGAEYEVIDSIIKDKLDIKIFCVEFDELYFHSLKSFFKIRRSIKKLLKSGYILSHKSGQNYLFIKKN